MVSNKVICGRSFPTAVEKKFLLLVKLSPSEPSAPYPHDHTLPSASNPAPNFSPSFILVRFNPLKLVSNVGLLYAVDVLKSPSANRL